MDNNQTSPTDQTTKTGHRWLVTKLLPIVIVLILLIGIGLWYFFFVSQKAHIKTSPVPAEPEKITNEAQVKLLPQGSNGLSGQVDIVEIDKKKIRANIFLDPTSAKSLEATASANFFAEIFTGTCEKIENRKLKLASTTSWTTNTIQQVNFDSFKQLNETTIMVIVKEETATAKPIACGKIYYQYQN